MTTSTLHPAIVPLLPPSWEVMSDVCSESGRKAVASAVGLSPACIHKWCEDREVSGALNPLDRIIAITRLTGDTRLIEWLCAAPGAWAVDA